MKKFRLTAAFCAAILAASLFTGCKSDSSENTSETSANESVTTTAPVSDSGDAVITNVPVDDVTEGEIITETRPIAEGDDYAINKINNKTAGETLPGGYVLREYAEEQQGKLYNNEKSKIVIRAYNYIEDLQDMAIWADSACAMIVMSNSFNYGCDTEFGEPENTKVAGFDAIRYDYEIIQNEFIENEENPAAAPEEKELYRFKARVYYFYSEQDAYVIQFDTRKEDWEEQVALFEEFVADLEVTKTEY